MSVHNDIVLRPRFKLSVSQKNEIILKLFEDAKNNPSNFIISRVDDHVFIRISRAKQHFWSPQLHLEIIDSKTNGAIIHGLFGPNPTVWTLFMFLHFIVAGLFIVFLIWTYVNWSLSQSYALQIFVSLFMIVIWIALYAGGRLAKNTGRAQMQELQDFMRDTLRSHNVHLQD